MATRRTKTVEEPAVEEATPSDQGKKQTASSKKASSMVKVLNKGRYFFVQPSTGIRIPAGQVTEVRDDAWLSLQLKAGLFERQ